MRAFVQLVRKNIIVLFREKSAAILLVLGPLLMVFLLGLAFDNTNTYALNIGIYTPTPQATGYFIDRLRERQFHVVQVNNEEQCTEMIKDGSLHACIAFPQDFSLQEKGKNEITFYVDYSRINIVYLVLETLTSKLSAQAKDISVNLTNVLLDKLEGTRKEIFVKRPLLSSVGKKNKDITDALNSLAGEIGQADVTLAAPNTAQLKILTDDKDLEDSITTIRRFIALARGNINDAEHNAATFTNPDGTNPVMEDLRRARGALKALEDDVSKEFIPVRSALTRIREGLGAVEENVKAAQQKMNTFAQIKTTASSTNREIAQKTSEISSDVQILQAAFETIDQNIGSIQIRNAADIVNPISTAIKAVNAGTTHLNSIFPSLLTLVIMFISILLGTTLVVMEKNSPAHFRNSITPVSDASFVMATWATCIILVLGQVAIMLLVAGIAFSIPISLLTILFSIIIGISLFSVMGMALGYVFASEETATIAGISIGTLFLFFSNTIIPLESLPSSIQNIVQYSPYLMNEGIIRKLAFYNLGIGTVSQELLFLLSYMLAFLMFSYFIQAALRKHLAHQWTYAQKQRVLSLSQSIRHKEAAPMAPANIPAIGKDVQKGKRIYTDKRR